MTPAIQGTGLVRTFGSVLAVDQIDLTVRQGECFGMLGPNGAGKTTITRMVQAVLPRTAGELAVLGLDPNRSGAELRARIGVVPQGDNLDPDLSCYSNLWTYARFFGQGRKQARESAERLLDFARLTDRREARPRELSGGMRRRLMIARAMVNEPELLLLDEPTTALDPQARHTVWGWLQKLKDEGLTMVLTTHDMDEAQRLCDRLCVIDHGKRLLEGEPEALVDEHVGLATLEFQLSKPDDLTSVLFGSYRLEETGDSTLAHFRDDNDARQTLNQALDAGLAANLRRASLEDLFLKLTGRALRQ
jgi:lipooligosaccharide transport system ATP-binding protein